jgi:hypothetical protein
MKSQTLIAVFLSVALLFALAVAAQRGADHARAAAADEELLYLPNEKLLNHFTGGLSSIVADMLWLKCVQYVGTQVQGDRDFTWLNHMLNTVVRLDPYFKDAYRYGGMFLAALRADSDAGLDLLERGMVQCPDAWELPYEAAMIHLLNRRDQPGALQRVAYFLSMSAATGKAPGMVLELAQRLQSEYNMVDIEREMWAGLLESGDRLLSEMAARKLIELRLREACDIMNERAAHFTAAQGRLPASLEELAGGRLPPELLEDPLGGRFFLDASGRVWNTSILDEELHQRRGVLRNAIEKFRNQQGVWPPRIESLVEARLLNTIPPHPYPDQAWRYDPATGEIE